MYFLYTRQVLTLLLIFLIELWHVAVPFNRGLGLIPNYPVPVEALPDIG